MADNTPTPLRQPGYTVLPLYLGFATTGIGVALPGAILPAILARWHLTDSQGGLFFLLAWIGSSVGALAVRGSLRVTLCIGCILGALGAAGFALPYGSGPTADAWITLYGLGLGLVMTSISLLRQATAIHSGTDLIRLNLFWAVGACACPALASPALRTGDVRPVFGSLAAAFILLALWAALQRQIRDTVRHGPDLLPRGLRGVPPVLIILIMLITGVEASAGAWLATYAHRGGDRLTEVVAAPTCLWAGLLVSRFAWSTWARHAPSHSTVRGSALMMLSGALLLMLGASGWPVLLAAFLLGAGIGPIYPLVLDWVLHIERGGTIFFLAGVGSATLPWLTGVTSQAKTSLRSGFIVPLIGAAVVSALAWISPLARWSTPRQNTP